MAVFDGAKLEVYKFCTYLNYKLDLILNLMIQNDKIKKFGDGF